MASHSNYWSCSPIADWIRGTKKLNVGTSQQWNEWSDEAQLKHKFRYWVAEEFLGYLQDFVTYPVRKLYDLKYYVNNRWVSHSHALTAHPRDIKPGKWRDVGNRFLPCLFNELVDFVEIEQASHHIAWGSKEERAKYNSPFWACGWFKWRTWRCPQAGLDYLDWAMSLTNTDWCDPTDPEYGKPTHQAIRSGKIKELYLWWTTVYRNRPDPYDASGWSDYCEASRLANGGKLLIGDLTPELKKMSNKAHKLLTKIETQYEKEDTLMLKRLIDIRGSLWT